MIIDKDSMQIHSMKNLGTNKAEQTKSVPSIAEQTPITENTASASIIQCSDNWIQMQHSIKLEEKQNKRRIEIFVKQHLFKDLRFIPSQEMMIFSLRNKA